MCILLAVNAIIAPTLPSELEGAITDHAQIVRRAKDVQLSYRQSHLNRRDTFGSTDAPATAGGNVNVIDARYPAASSPPKRSRLAETEHPVNQRKANRLSH